MMERTYCGHWCNLTITPSSSIKLAEILRLSFFTRKVFSPSKFLAEYTSSTRNAKFLFNNLLINPFKSAICERLWLRARRAFIEKLVNLKKIIQLAVRGNTIRIKVLYPALTVHRNLQTKCTVSVDRNVVD